MSLSPKKTTLAEIFGISESVLKKLWPKFSATVTLSQNKTLAEIFGNCESVSKKNLAETFGNSESVSKKNSGRNSKFGFQSLTSSGPILEFRGLFLMVMKGKWMLCGTFLDVFFGASRAVRRPSAVRF